MTEKAVGVVRWFEDFANDTYKIGIPLEGEKLTYFNGKGKFPFPFEKSDTKRPEVEVTFQKENSEIIALDKLKEVIIEKKNGKPIPASWKSNKKKKFEEAYKIVMDTVDKTLFSAEDIRTMIDTVYMRD